MANFQGLYNLFQQEQRITSPSGWEEYQRITNPTPSRRRTNSFADDPFGRGNLPRRRVVQDPFADDPFDRPSREPEPDPFDYDSYWRETSRSIRHGERVEDEEGYEIDYDEPEDFTGDLDDIGRSEDAWGDDYEPGRDGGLPDDPNETRDDEQWDAWGAPKRLADDPRDDATWDAWGDDVEILRPNVPDPFAGDPFGRGALPRRRGPGGLPDDPNETRDDEQWDAWGAPKRLADDPRDDATWQPYDYEQPVRYLFDIDSYWRDTFGFRDVEDIRRQGEQPWSDDYEPRVYDDDDETRDDATWDAWGAPKRPAEVRDPSLLTPAQIEDIYYAYQGEDPLSLTQLQYDIVYGHLRPDFAGGPQFYGDTRGGATVDPRPSLVSIAQEILATLTQSVPVSLASSIQMEWTDDASFLVGATTFDATYVDEYAEAVLSALTLAESLVSPYPNYQANLSAVEAQDYPGANVMAIEVWEGALTPAPKAVADSPFEQMDPGVSGSALTEEEITEIYYAKQGEDPLSLTLLEYDIVYGRMRPDFAGGPRVGGGDTGGPGGRLPPEAAGDDPKARILKDLLEGAELVHAGFNLPFPQDLYYWVFEGGALEPLLDYRDHLERGEKPPEELVKKVEELVEKQAELEAKAEELEISFTSGLGDAVRNTLGAWLDEKLGNKPLGLAIRHSLINVINELGSGFEALQNLNNMLVSLKAAGILTDADIKILTTLLGIEQHPDSEGLDEQITGARSEQELYIQAYKAGLLDSQITQGGWGDVSNIKDFLDQMSDDELYAWLKWRGIVIPSELGEKPESEALDAAEINEFYERYLKGEFNEDIQKIFEAEGREWQLYQVHEYLRDASKEDAVKWLRRTLGDIERTSTGGPAPSPLGTLSANEVQDYIRRLKAGDFDELLTKAGTTASAVLSRFGTDEEAAIWLLYLETYHDTAKIGPADDLMTAPLTPELIESYQERIRRGEFDEVFKLFDEADLAEWLSMTHEEQAKFLRQHDLDELEKEAAIDAVLSSPMDPAKISGYILRLDMGEFDSLLDTFDDADWAEWYGMTDKEKAVVLRQHEMDQQKEGGRVTGNKIKTDALAIAEAAEAEIRNNATSGPQGYLDGLSLVQESAGAQHEITLLTDARPPNPVPLHPNSLEYYNQQTSGFWNHFQIPNDDWWAQYFPGQVPDKDALLKAAVDQKLYREYERYAVGVELAVELAQGLIGNNPDTAPYISVQTHSISIRKWVVQQDRATGELELKVIPSTILFGLSIRYKKMSDGSDAVPVDPYAPSGTITLPSPKAVVWDDIYDDSDTSETEGTRGYLPGEKVQLPEYYFHPLQEEVDFVPNPIGRVGGEAQVPEARGIRRGQHPEDRDYVAPGISLITDNVLIYQDPWSGERFYQDQDTGEWYHVDSKDGTITKRAPRRTDTPPITELPDDSTPLGRRLREILFDSLPDDMYYNPDIGHFVRINEHGQHIVQFDYSPWEYQAREGVTYEEREERHRRNQLRARAEADPNVFFDEQRGRLYYLDTITGTYVGTDDHGRPIIVDKDGNPVDVAALGLETTAQEGEFDPSVTGPTATLGERLPYYYDEITEQWIGVDEHGRPKTLDGPPEGYYWNAVTGIAFYQADDGLWYGRTVEGRVYMTDPSGFPIDPETGEFIDWQKPVNQPRDVVPHPYYYDEGLGKWVVVDPEASGGYRIAARPPEGYYYNAITKISFTQLADGTWMGLYEGRVVRVDDTGFPIDIEGNPVDWQQEGWIDLVWAGGVEPIVGEAFDRDWSNETPIALDPALQDLFEHYFEDEFGDPTEWNAGIFQSIPLTQVEGLLNLLKAERFDQKSEPGDQSQGPVYDIVLAYTKRVATNMARLAELAMQRHYKNRDSEVGDWLASHVGTWEDDTWGEGFEVGPFGGWGRSGGITSNTKFQGTGGFFRKDKEFEGLNWAKLIYGGNNTAITGALEAKSQHYQDYGLWLNILVRKEVQYSGLAQVEILYDPSSILSMLVPGQAEGQSSDQPGTLRMATATTYTPEEAELIGQLETEELFADDTVLEEKDWPDFPPLPTGESHREFDPGFDIPEVGDALYLAEMAASEIRRAVTSEIASSIRIMPAYENEGVRYLIGSNTAAANESKEYVEAVQQAILRLTEAAKERAVEDYMRIGLSSMQSTDDPSSSTMAVELWFGVRYNEETETWEAVRDRKTIDIWGSSRVRNAAMKDVVDFAVQALKRECPVRTGTMRNSISARPTDYSFKGNISTYWDIGARVQYSRFVASYRSAVDRAVVATKAYAAQYAHQGIEGIVVHEALIELPSGADKYGAPFGPGMVIEFGQAQGGFWKDLNFGPGSFDLIHPDVINWLFGTDLQPGDLTPPGLPGGSWDLPDEIADEDEYEDDDDDAKSSLPFRLRF